MRVRTATIALLVAVASSCGSKKSPVSEGESFTCGDVTPAAGQPADAPLWLAIVARDFVAAMAPLVDHRRRNGFAVEVSTAPPAQAIAAATRPPASDEKTGRRKFAAADASFEFERVAEHAAAASWHGVIDRPGLVRLTEMSSVGIKVAVFTVDE